MKLKIGVRGSKLALAYAERACKELSCDTEIITIKTDGDLNPCLLYTSPSPRDAHESRMPSSA